METSEGDFVDDVTICNSVPAATRDGVGGTSTARSVHPRLHLSCICDVTSLGARRPFEALSRPWDELRTRGVSFFFFFSFPSRGYGFSFVNSAPAETRKRKLQGWYFGVSARVPQTAGTCLGCCASCGERAIGLSSRANKQLPCTKVRKESYAPTAHGRHCKKTNKRDYFGNIQPQPVVYLDDAYSPCPCGNTYARVWRWLRRTPSLRHPAAIRVSLTCPINRRE